MHLRGCAHREGEHHSGSGDAVDFHVAAADRAGDVHPVFCAAHAAVHGHALRQIQCVGVAEVDPQGRAAVGDAALAPGHVAEDGEDGKAGHEGGEAVDVADVVVVRPHIGRRRSKRAVRRHIACSQPPHVGALASSKHGTIDCTIKCANADLEAEHLRGCRCQPGYLRVMRMRV